MKAQKTTHQVQFNVSNLQFLNGTFRGEKLVGYEIHMGDTTPLADSVSRCFTITSRSEEAVNVIDGFIDGNHQVMGTIFTVYLIMTSLDVLLSINYVNARDYNH